MTCRFRRSQWPRPVGLMGTWRSSRKNSELEGNLQRKQAFHSVSLGRILFHFFFNIVTVLGRFRNYSGSL